MEGVKSMYSWKYTSMQRLVDKLAAEHGKLDVLINNAGIASKNHPVDPILSPDPSDMLNVLTTNVIGNIVMTNAFLPLMKKSSKKVVVNLSSDLGSIHNVMQAQSAKVHPLLSPPCRHPIPSHDVTTDDGCVCM